MNKALPIPRDTQELLRKNPLFFSGSMEYSEAAWQKPFRLTFVLAQPRSGSTLLMRLMNQACLSEMLGDRPIEFFEGIVMMHEALKKPQHGQFGHIMLAEDRKEFWDEFRGTSRQRERYLFKHMSALVFGGNNFKSSYAKSTMIGFGNGLVESFVNMLRELYEDDKDCNLRIVFLRRPHDEIVHSFTTREGPMQETAKKEPNRILDMLADQDQQFKEARELGDPCITYEKLCTDTAATLNKLNPLYQPNLKAMEYIMANKIR